MQQLLGRIYELVITNLEPTPSKVVVDTGITSVLPESFAIAESIEIPFRHSNTRTIAQADRAVSRVWGSARGLDLRMQATLGKNNTNSNTNNATIKLFNISKEDLAFITTTVKRRYVSLRAGYKSIVNNVIVEEFDVLPEVFSGDVVSIISQQQGADLVTTISVKDSAASLRNTQVSKTFPKGTDKKEAIKQLLSSWDGLSWTNNSFSYKADFKSPSFTSAYTAYGSVSAVMDALVAGENIIWYTLNGTLYLINKTEPKLTRKITLNPRDVINQPSATQQSNLNAKNPKGLNIRVFLNGAIDTDVVITLENFDKLNGQDIDGDYNVRTIKHMLDNRGKSWFTDILMEAK